jgi:hypothetical protein
MKRAQRYFELWGYEVTQSGHADTFLAERPGDAGFVSVVAVVVDSVERAIRVVRDKIRELERLPGEIEGCVVLLNDACIEDRMQVESADLRPIPAEKLRPMGFNDLEILVVSQLKGLEAGSEGSRIEPGMDRTRRVHVEEACSRFLRSEQERLLVIVGPTEPLAQARCRLVHSCAKDFLDLCRHAPVLLSLSGEPPAKLEQLVGQVFSAHGAWHNPYDLRRLIEQGLLLPFFDGLVSPLRGRHALALVRQALDHGDDRARAVLFVSGDAPRANEISYALDLPTTAVRVLPLSGDTAESIDLFILAADKDGRWLGEFKRHLAPLRNLGVQTFDINDVPVGSDGRRELLAALARAETVVLLVTPHLLAGHGDIKELIEQALVAKREGRIELVPVLVSACAWEDEPYGRLVPLPRDRKPVDAGAPRDPRWREIVQTLRKVIEGRRGRPLK